MLILAQYLATGVPYESVLQRIEWVMSMILLHVIRFPKKTLTETCFYQDGINRFKPQLKPLMAETCQV